jgi:hypothetical protein
MPLAFSIFSSKRSSAAGTTAPMTQPVQEEKSLRTDTDGQAEQQDAFQSPFLSKESEPFAKSPFPANASSEDHTELLAPPQSLYSANSEPVSWLPMKRDASGLAALAVNQSGAEAPPLNRKPSVKSFPGLSPFPVESKEERSDFLPPASPFMAVGDEKAPLTSADNLREELHEEINQVRNDLFGAVMGVSALKDRLDDLETSVLQNAAPAAAQPAPSIDRAEIESWISAWLETHLPAALDRALARLEEKTHSSTSMSTTSWFRQPVHFQSPDRHTLLTQAPIVIASTPV